MTLLWPYYSILPWLLCLCVWHAPQFHPHVSPSGQPPRCIRYSSGIYIALLSAPFCFLYFMAFYLFFNFGHLSPFILLISAYLTLQSQVFLCQTHFLQTLSFYSLLLVILEFYNVSLNFEMFQTWMTLLKLSHLLYRYVHCLFITQNCFSKGRNFSTISSYSKTKCLYQSSKNIQ